MRDEKEIKETLEDNIKLDKALGTENLSGKAKGNPRWYARKFGRWLLSNSTREEEENNG